MNSPAVRLALLIPILFAGFATTFGILWVWIQFNPADSAYWMALVDYVLENQSIPTPFKISLPAGFAVALLLALSTRFVGKSSNYGDARSASRRDIRRAGLKNQPGVVCGAKGQRLLAFDGPRTAAVIAPAGAGKSVGIINPTVVNLPASVSAIIHDPKDEIRQATSGWRSKVSKVYRFSPTDPTSDPWNPLNEEDLPGNLGDLQSYVDMLNAVLFPAEGETSETHWKLAAAAATKAATLFNIFNARSRGRSTSYSEIYSWFAQAGRDSAYDESKDPVRDWLSDKADEATSNNWPASIADGLNLLALKADRERASVISTAVTRLEMFANENVAKMTSESAFSLKDVREAETSVTIYMHLPENVRKSMGRLTGLFLQCLANQVLSYPEHVARSLNPVCFVLDELP
ncbi:MAG: type IV secretory system conjugative DNA transfer family protein, partial [Rhodospirillales bacterium]|nr:type IV secretory system conjugative DNA transfer family protein [Rhodospirillales bacterium]